MSETANLRHPMFDTTEPPTLLDCLNAIDRTACVIDLFDHLNLASETAGELTPGAVAGFRYLSEMMLDTLVYTSGQLATLSRKRNKEAREQARTLSALANSLAAAGDDDLDDILNARTRHLQVTRAEVDEIISNAKRE